MNIPYKRGMKKNKEEKNDDDDDEDCRIFSSLFCFAISRNM